MNRHFHVKAPNVKWLPDITEFQIQAVLAIIDGIVTPLKKLKSYQ